MYKSDRGPEAPWPFNVKPPKYKYIADAIRRGAQIYPYRSHKYIDPYNRASCAVGAAFAGGLTHKQIGAWIELRIIWKHDVRGWTKLQVADWLETL